MRDGADFDVRLNPGQLRRLRRVLADAVDIRQGLVDVVGDITTFVRGRAQDIVTGQSYDTGALARGIAEEHNGLQGRVFTQLAYGIVVEEGRAPGSKPPPPQQLVGWIRRHGLTISPIGLAILIGRRGIPAKPFMAPALRAGDREAGKVLGEFGDKVQVRWGRDT